MQAGVGCSVAASAFPQAQDFWRCLIQSASCSQLLELPCRAWQDTLYLHVSHKVLMVLILPQVSCCLAGMRSRAAGFCTAGLAFPAAACSPVVYETLIVVAESLLSHLQRSCLFGCFSKLLRCQQQLEVLFNTQHVLSTAMAFGPAPRDWPQRMFNCA